jgi:uncharacterized membrane protein
VVFVAVHQIIPMTGGIRMRFAIAVVQCLPSDKYLYKVKLSHGLREGSSVALSQKSISNYFVSILTPITRLTISLIKVSGRA